MYGSGNYPTNALGLVPISSWSTGSTSGAGCALTTTNCYFLASGLYFGYALRDNNIYTFATTTLLENALRINARVSLVGFDSLSLSSPDDSANIYGMNFIGTNEGETKTFSWASSRVSEYCETLTDSFSRYSSHGTGVSQFLFLSIPYKALYNGSPTIYPYEAPLLTTDALRDESPLLNSNGITSKGTFNVDLLSCNGTYGYSDERFWKSYANGNYLLIASCHATASNERPSTKYYVGWDPSNPDITSEDAWTAYNG
jgi:hypothetical protein